MTQNLEFVTGALKAATGLPFEIMARDGTVLVRGVVGTWATVMDAGMAVNAVVDIVGVELLLVPFEPAMITRGL